jgi:hypothetical protein
VAIAILNQSRIYEIKKRKDDLGVNSLRQLIFPRCSTYPLLKKKKLKRNHLMYCIRILPDFFFLIIYYVPHYIGLTITVLCEKGNFLMYSPRKFKIATHRSIYRRETLCVNFVMISKQIFFTAVARVFTNLTLW